MNSTNFLLTKGEIKMKKSIILTIILTFTFIISAFAQTSFAALPTGGLFQKDNFKWATTNVIYGWAKDADIPNRSIQVQVKYWDTGLRAWQWGGYCYSNYPTGTSAGNNGFWCKAPTNKEGTMIKVTAMNSYMRTHPDFGFVYKQIASSGHKEIFYGPLRKFPEDWMEDNYYDLKVRASTGMWKRTVTAYNKFYMRVRNRTWSYDGRNINNVKKKVYKHRSILTIWGKWDGKDRKVRTRTRTFYKDKDGTNRVTHSDYWYDEPYYTKRDSDWRAIGHSRFKKYSNSMEIKMTTRQVSSTW